MTFLDSAGDGVVKMDTAGQIRVSRERREQLLREFGTSGISAGRTDALFEGTHFQRMTRDYQSALEQEAFRI